jgi:excisionase family DNA binding protein
MTDAIAARKKPLERLLHPVPEAAQLLGLGTSTCWALIKAGKLQTVKIGRRTLITRASIERIAGGAT